MTDAQYGWLFLKSMLITQTVEVPIAWLLFSMILKRKNKSCDQTSRFPLIPGSSSRIIAAAVICNLTTLPWLWYVYPGLMTYSHSVLLGEITAFGVEALIYQLIIGAGYRSSLFVSAVANTASIGVGLLIMPPWG